MFSVWISVNIDEVQCGCKRLRREHSWDVNTDPKAKWNQEKHTRAAYNNAFGQIPDSTAKYLRCDIQTDPKILSNFMFDTWKIKEPQLIMCIIGGAKYFKLNERLEREFMKGIIRAALKASKLYKFSSIQSLSLCFCSKRWLDHHNRLQNRRRSTCWRSYS